MTATISLTSAVFTQILSGASGLTHPETGLDGDDILFGRYLGCADEQDQKQFWTALSEALGTLWQAQNVLGFMEGGRLVYRLAVLQEPQLPDDKEIFTAFLSDNDPHIDPTHLEMLSLAADALLILETFGLRGVDYWRSQIMAAMKAIEITSDVSAGKCLLHAWLGWLNVAPLASTEWSNLIASVLRSKEVPQLELLAILSQYSESAQDTHDKEQRCKRMLECARTGFAEWYVDFPDDIDDDVPKQTDVVMQIIKKWRGRTGIDGANLSAEIARLAVWRRNKSPRQVMTEESEEELQAA